MLIGDPTDTIMNLGTFVFIGFLVWILMRKSPGSED
jgi:hypothetical protein